jgi:hypothetical protein
MTADRKKVKIHSLVKNKSGISILRNRMNLYFLDLISGCKQGRRETTLNGKLPNGRQESVTYYLGLGLLMVKNGEKKVSIELEHPSLVSLWIKNIYIHLQKNWTLMIGNRDEVFSDIILDLTEIPSYNMVHLSYLKRLKISFLSS